MSNGVLINVSGKIIICATPIGNLGDVSSRLVDSLNSADKIYAEDTRVTSKLLSHFGIKTSILRLDENLMENKVNVVINEVLSGKIVCYCSDAGMPGVSDPGLKLVAAAHEKGIEVEVLPGPSASITAYVASGFTNSKFYFGGFLPRKSSDLNNELRELLSLNAVLIFYESPNRLLTSLKTIVEVDSNIRIAVCRELTKIHEEVVRGSACEVLKDFSKRESIKGEIVICIDSVGKQNNTDDTDQINNIAKKIADEGLKTSAIASLLCDLFQISKNDAKKVAINAKK